MDASRTELRVVFLAAFAAAGIAAGCGGDDRDSNADRYEGTERDVAALVDELAEAGREGDGERICEELFTEALARNVESESRQSCVSAVAGNLPEDEYELDVEDVDVQGPRATAEVTDQDDRRSVLHLAKSGEDWRVARVTGD